MCSKRAPDHYKYVIGAVMYLISPVNVLFGQWQTKHQSCALLTFCINLLDHDEALVSLEANELSQCGLMTPYGDTDLGQHWLS